MTNTVDIWEPVKPSRGRCGMAIHMRHKVHRNKHMIIGVLCQSWKCDTCGPYLRKKWDAHLAGKITQEESIFVSMVNKSRWGTVAKRILRATGQFATVEQADGILTVFTTIAEGEKVSESTALSLLTKAIQGAITDHRPIHTSRGWSLPKDAAPKAGEWERVDRLSAPVSVVEKAVIAMHLRVMPFWAELRTGFVVELPFEWGDDEVSEFSKYLVAVDGEGYQEV